MPTMPAWEHISVRFYNDPPTPWYTASQKQMDTVQALQRDGYEVAAMTTLHDGSLFIMFKRPNRGDGGEAILPRESKGIQIGFAAPGHP